MSFIDIPNIPHKEVTHVLADGRISAEAEMSLNRLGICVVKTIRHPSLYEAISCHPDVVFYHVGVNLAICAPGIDVTILESLSNLGFNLIKGSCVLASDYPLDIPYNAARVGNFVIHNFKHTDTALLNTFEQHALTRIDVKQGYSKCLISIVDEKSIITADKGIAQAAEKKGLDVLLIDQNENIELPGLNRGFIGGATGLIGPKLWALNGKFENLKCCKQIAEFLDKRGITPISLTHDTVIDIGSIIPLLTK